VIISACYSGVFIRRLASPDTLVITAADAHHSSFGCEDRATWTYFGDAFFNVALRRAKTLKHAFVHARALVSKRERRMGFDRSHPQMAGGKNVEMLLVARPPLHGSGGRTRSKRHATIRHWLNGYLLRAAMRASADLPAGFAFGGKKLSIVVGLGWLGERAPTLQTVLSCCGRQLSRSAELPE
jgi:Peptidase C13 family